MCVHPAFQFDIQSSHLLSNYAQLQAGVNTRQTSRVKQPVEGRAASPPLLCTALTVCELGGRNRANFNRRQVLKVGDRSQDDSTPWN